MARMANSSDDAGTRIEAVRKARGWSRRHAASILGIHEQRLYQLERGEGSISLDRLWDIAEKWNVDPSKLDPRFAPQAPKPEA